MPEKLAKHTAKTIVVMSLFTALATLLLVSVFFVTKPPIDASEAQARLALLNEVMPHHAYDNELLQQTITLPPDALLGNTKPSQAYMALYRQHFAGIILEAIAHDGYSGDIKLLIAIQADGSLSGVRVLAHKETPGLGDYIERVHSDWILHFDHQSLQSPPAARWLVKKDGGAFDYMTGATITPRAVVKAVKHALEYFHIHQERLTHGYR